MKIVKRIKSYFSYHWSWIGVLVSSPFVGLRLKWYFGNVSMGVPYFLPKNNWFKFNYVSLGWKTKYDSFRHEWDPRFSLVILKKQIVIFVLPKTDCSSSTMYWEAWLDYKYKTDKNGSIIDRVKELTEKHSQTWITHKNDERISINYYYKILKPKYHPYIIDTKIEEDEENNTD